MAKSEAWDKLIDKHVANFQSCRVPTQPICTYCSWMSGVSEFDDALRELIAHTLDKHPEHKDDPLLIARPDLWPEGSR